MKHLTSVVLGSVCAAVFLVAFGASASTAWAAADPVVDSRVEEALFADHWSEVMELLSDVEETTPSPVARLVKGHAALALNRNNESLLLFSTLSDDKSRAVWLRWATDLAERRPTAVVAWYFQGDGYARLREWSKAEESFEKALDLNPDYYLAWNARGVVAHAAGSTLQARQYFSRAASTGEQFADAYASRGTLNVYLHSTRAHESFEQAVRLSSDDKPATSLLGMGCVAHGRALYKSAQEYFSRVPNIAPAFALARQNTVATSAAALAVAVGKLEKVGTSIGIVEVDNEDGTGLFDQQQRLFTWTSKQSDSVWEFDFEVTLGGGLWPGEIKIGGRRRPRPNPPPSPEPAPPSEGESTEETTRAQEQIAIASALREATARILTNVTTPTGPFAFPGLQDRQDQPTAPNPDLVGGATSDPSGVTTNQGQWGVHGLYGLLYDLP